MVAPIALYLHLAYLNVLLAKECPTFLASNIVKHLYPLYNIK